MFVELLFEISREVGYTARKVQLKRGIYTPKAHGDVEELEYQIRKGLHNFLEGNRTISIAIKNPHDHKENIGESK